MHGRLALGVEPKEADRLWIDSAQQCWCVRCDEGLQVAPLTGAAQLANDPTEILRRQAVLRLLQRDQRVYGRTETIGIE